MEDRERTRTGISSLKVRYNRVFGYYIEVSKSNLGAVPYRIIAPNVSVLAAEGNAANSMPPVNLQLGAGYLERFGKMSSTPVELLHSEIDQQDVAPGKISTGVIAIRSADGSPRISRT